MADHFRYTQSQKAAIEAAYNNAAYIVERFDHNHEFDAATKFERKARSCVHVAKALVANGFLEGFTNNPRASEIAGTSPGIRTAIILGADAKRRGRPTDDSSSRAYERVPALGRAAAAAHDEYLRSGCERARVEIVQSQSDALGRCE